MEHANNCQPPEATQMGHEVDTQINEAVFRLFQEVLPLLGDTHSRELLLRNLDRFVLWLRLMPRPITPKRWTYEEFETALSVPDALAHDPRFGAYMDAFYEEYKENPEDELQAFYDKLFQNEQELSKVDWPSVWASIRASYENWLETEYEDEWLKGELND